MTQLPPETLAEKVFDITRECQERSKWDGVGLSALEDALTTILEEDGLDVVVIGQPIDDSIDIKLSSVYQSERGNRILARYSELCGYAIVIHPINLLPGEWRI